MGIILFLERQIKMSHRVKRRTILPARPPQQVSSTLTAAGHVFSIASFAHRCMSVPGKSPPLAVLCVAHLHAREPLQTKGVGKPNFLRESVSRAQQGNRV